MSLWWSLCTLYLSHAGCDVNCSSAITSLCLLILQKSAANWRCLMRKGDSGHCCCGPAFNVWRQLFERNYFPLFVDSTEVCCQLALLDAQITTILFTFTVCTEVQLSCNYINLFFVQTRSLRGRKLFNNCYLQQWQSAKCLLLFVFCICLSVCRCVEGNVCRNFAHCFVLSTL